MPRIKRVLGVPGLRARFRHGLRFRLALSYAIFFGVLLVIIGLIFRQNLMLETDGDTRATLEEEWGAAKGYLKIENQRPVWIADHTDPEEAYIVARLQHVYLLTDAQGTVLQNSETYKSIGIDSPEEIRRMMQQSAPEIHIRQDKTGIPYMIKAGMIPDEQENPYFFAIGRSLEDGRRTVATFTRNYFVALPGMLALASLLGWVVAGRAIRPLNHVAQAAHTITGSNLSLQIPLRGAGDELDHLIDSFNRMTSRLKESFEQIRRFSTDVSHELRTPLTAVRGQLEVALFTAEKPEQYRDAIVNALEDVERLSSIVRALLLLSQAESGQLVLQRTVFDLSDVVEDVVEQFQIPAEEKNISLTAELGRGASVLADHTQIERLLSNLLSNALKYTPNGGTVRVRLSRHDSPEWLRLEVEDTGAGIPAENLPQIFDRFYRVRNSQTNLTEGLGLGLSFVAWIVEVHGGRIDVVSTLDKGSRFSVFLPARTQAVEKEAPEPTAASVD